MTEQTLIAFSTIVLAYIVGLTVVSSRDRDPVTFIMGMLVGSLGLTMIGGVMVGFK